ncbi:MAG: roadblock/LC7 domain-containing protein [Candidatus Freyrarchaeum guaymaensis]
MSTNDIGLVEEVINESFKSSNFDTFLLDKSGNVIFSRLTKEGEEIGENAIALLENCKCISSCLSEREVEDFLLHGKGGYIIAVTIGPWILAVSGVPESEIEETLQQLKEAAKEIQEKGLANWKGF